MPAQHELIQALWTAAAAHNLTPVSRINGGGFYVKIPIAGFYGDGEEFYQAAVLPEGDSRVLLDFETHCCEEDGLGIIEEEFPHLPHSAESYLLDGRYHVQLITDQISVACSTLGYMLGNLYDIV